MNTLQTKSTSSFKKQRGVMLIEGLIAILIFSLGVLAMVGMQAQAINHTSQAKYRADAAFGQQNYRADVGRCPRQPDELRNRRAKVQRLENPGARSLFTARPDHRDRYGRRLYGDTNVAD